MAEGDIPNKDSFDYKMGTINGLERSMAVLNIELLRARRGEKLGLSVSIRVLNTQRSILLRKTQEDLDKNLKEARERDAQS